MKRPQGFDADAQQAEPQRPTKARQPRPQRGKPERGTPERSAPDRRTSERVRTASAAPAEQRQPALTDAAPTSGSRRALRVAKRERRRVERREVRRFTRRARTHRAAWIGSMSVLVALGALLAAAVFSPLLSFEKLEIRGASGVDEAAVRDVVEAQLGTPLALLDYSAIREGLARIPLIRSFATEVTPPHTLTIHLVERQPIGVVRSEAGFAVVDPAGVVLERVTERPEGLARINVDEASASGVGFAAVVEVLLALPADLRARVDAATATTRDDVRLTLGPGGEQVVWGSADRSELKARVLESLLAATPSGGAVEFDVSAPLSPVVRSR